VTKAEAKLLKKLCRKPGPGISATFRPAVLAYITAREQDIPAPWDIDWAPPPEDINDDDEDWLND
jgi:hypothetical protein